MNMHWIQTMWASEQRMFTVATVLVLGGGGMFVFAPLVAFAVLMSGPAAQIAVVSTVTAGCIAFVRALILQRRRYAAENNS